MILTGDTEVLWSKRIPLPLHQPQAHRTDPGSNPGLRCERPTINCLNKAPALPRLRKDERSFPFNAPRFPKEHCFLDGFRLRPFILFVTATCRWRWVWSIDGITVTGENRSTWRNPCSSATLYSPPMDWPGMEPGPPCPRLTLVCIIYKDAVCTSQRTQCACLGKTNGWILYRELRDCLLQESYELTH
jgi:hypothetical protein